MRDIPKYIQPLLIKIMSENNIGQELLKRIRFYPWHQMWETGGCDKQGQIVIKYHLLISDSFVCHNIKMYELQTDNRQMSNPDYIFNYFLDQLTTNGF